MNMSELTEQMKPEYVLLDLSKEGTFPKVFVLEGEFLPATETQLARIELRSRDAQSVIYHRGSMDAQDAASTAVKKYYEHVGITISDTVVEHIVFDWPKTMKFTAVLFVVEGVLCALKK
ncbi:hypothetical protein [Xenorhabdus sp. KK7.4]|uniref:hypothetical protein n=1 Tax=Xenorhabdus sp. KK7.4 TaxID=1851572 RepID=UPI000C0516E6|nr:hypothetical protein [Xenorhabdus sp. KK7.4]PHM52067.1 hypothetical protein Xekk_03292 [Xenorhabdus sp. KK7.4]